MQINDLVKVRSHTVEEYALLVEIGSQDNYNWVRVRYFDGEEEILHPTQITPVRKDRTKNVLDNMKV
jgi:hypothetical protein